MACELAAQAVRQLALTPGAEEAGQVAGGRARLLLGLADRVQLVQPQPGELGGVDLGRRWAVR